MCAAVPKYGYIGGILSYFFYSLPGLIMCLVMGWLMYGYDNNNAPKWFIHAQKGLACSGIAFALQASTRLSSLLDGEKKKPNKKESMQPDNPMFPYILLTIVAIVSMLYRASWLLPVLLVAGAILGVLNFEVTDKLSKRIQKHYLYNILECKEKKFSKLTWKQKLRFIKLFIRTFSESEAREMIRMHEHEAEEKEEEELQPANPFKNYGSLKLGVSLIVLYVVLFAILFASALIVENATTVSNTSTSSLSEFTVTNTTTTSVTERKMNIWTEWLVISSFFYRCGSLIFGGAVVNVFILRDEMVERKWMTSDQFINGYSLTNAAPGPRFNIAAYYGATIASNLMQPNNVTTDAFNNSTSSGTSQEYSSVLRAIAPPIYGIISVIAFNLPGFILLLAVIPLWGSLRSKPIVQKAMNGVNAVCVGYLINNIVIMWISVVGTNVPLAAVALLTFAMVNWIDFWHPAVVFVGAFVTVILGLFLPIA